MIAAARAGVPSTPLPLTLREFLTVAAFTFAAAPGVVVAQSPAARPPNPPGTLVDIGGQKIHLNCTGSGSPAVLLEGGTGDFSVVWALVQPGVAGFTRVCSYDRGGYAWSDPGQRPRSFAQLALELRTALDRAHIPPPFAVVGQSYGGLVVRGFAERYRTDVVGMVLVDAVHEDQRVVIGGEPVRISGFAKGRPFPAPHIALDTATIRLARDSALRPLAGPLEPPLDRLPLSAQRVWSWAAALPIYRMTLRAETDWSPEELSRMHQQRLTNRASLGAMPLIVLARTLGDYPTGMTVSADSLDAERRALQADLAALSSHGRLVFAPSSGHNIHIEDPELVIRSIHEIVRSTSRGPS